MDSPPPPLPPFLLLIGWLKVNIFSSFWKGKAGLGVVVRNKDGELVLLKSKI